MINKIGMQDILDLQKLVEDVKKQISESIEVQIKACADLPTKEKQETFDRINKLKALMSEIVMPSQRSLENGVDVSVANSEVIRKLNNLVSELKIMMKV